MNKRTSSTYNSASESDLRRQLLRQQKDRGEVTDESVELTVGETERERERFLT
ncbi:hypothetical protein J6590_098410 [Homalodisca vitripennis]|nr:hypothetical protein J6590_098410 [Homalodisca vitripennis]